MARVLRGVSGMIEGDYCQYRGKKMKRSGRDVFGDME